MLRYWLTVFALTALAAGVQAAETLDDAWAAALAADNQLAAAQAERDSAEHLLAGARAERMPRLDVSTSAAQVDSTPRFAFGDSFVSPELFSGDSLLYGGAQLNMPIYTSGQLKHSIASAESMLVAHKGQVTAAEQHLRLAVAEAYINVLRGERALEVFDSVVTGLSAQAEVAKNRFDLGFVPKNDYLAASVSLADAKLQKLKIEYGLDVARAAYNRQLGRPLNETVALAPKISLPNTEIEDIDALIARALAARPELMAFGARADAFRSRSSAERSKLMPQFALIGGYTFLENQVLDDEKFWWAGVGLSWNVFDSGRTRNRAAATARQADAVERKQQDFASVIDLEVRSAWLDWQEAKRRQDVTQLAVEQANENLRVARDRYRAGAGTNAEVLDAETLRALSRNNHDNAYFDTALARLRLARATGSL